MKPTKHHDAPTRETYNHVRTLGASIVERIDPSEVELSDSERLRLWVTGHFLAKAWCGAEYKTAEDLPDPATCPADPEYFLPWGKPPKSEALRWYRIVKVSLGSDFTKIVPQLLVTLEELHGESPRLTPEEKEILSGPLSDFLAQGPAALAQRQAA